MQLQIQKKKKKTPLRYNTGEKGNKGERSEADRSHNDPATGTNPHGCAGVRRSEGTWQLFNDI